MKKDKRVKLNGMEQLLIDLKPRRCDADVYLKDEIDVTELSKYLEKKKKEGKSYTYFHAILLAFAKTIYNRPKLNRYVKNRHVYEHSDVSISFVAKIKFEDSSEEMALIIPVEKDDTIDTISKKIKGKVDSLRSNKFDVKGANNAMDILGKLPNIIRVPIVGLAKFIDRFNVLPKFLKDDNIYFASAIVTDIGVFKIPAIYHNNTNLGTASSITAIGEVEDKEILEKGKPVKKKVVSIGVNLDERIADGFYMIKAYKLLSYILNNPKLLETKASEKISIPKKEM